MKRLMMVFLLIAATSIPQLAQATLVQSSGMLTLVRVHDLGTKYGPSTDSIDVEVVITLDTKPGYAFGFQLRNDTYLPARQGMLDLLRDAFRNGWKVGINYDIDSGKKNGIINRVWVTK